MFQVEISITFNSLSPVIAPNKWILLLYGLPTKKGAARVNLWRQLKKCGALPLKTSAYLLPDKPEHHERLQWLAQQVRDGGGEATIIHVTEIEGLGSEDIVRQFNEARATDYAAFLSALTELIARNRKRPDESFAADLEKLTRQFEEIRKIDFFDCPRAQDAQMLLKRAVGLRGGKSKNAPTLATKRFIGKTWLTRPRPEIDRVGSAWLIRKFIDPRAKFIFAKKAPANRAAVSFDMLDADFSHRGDDCTFETLIKNFRIQDRIVRKIGEMVHDADFDYNKFERTECIGIDHVFKGWAKESVSDQEILRRGFQCFDALHAFLRRV